MMIMIYLVQWLDCKGLHLSFCEFCSTGCLEIACAAKGPSSMRTLTTNEPFIWRPRFIIK